MRAPARLRPPGKLQAFRRIITLREAVYHIFPVVALPVVAPRGLPARADLDTLNVKLADASPHLRLVAAPPDGSGCGAPEGEAGGYTVNMGAGADDGRVENLRTLIDTVMEYGVY